MTSGNAAADTLEITLTERASQTVLPETSRRLRRLAWVFFLPLAILAGIGAYYLTEDRRLAHQRAQAEAHEFLDTAGRQIGLSNALIPELSREADGAWKVLSEVEPEAVIYRDWNGNDLHPRPTNEYAAELASPVLDEELAQLWDAAEEAEFRQTTAAGAEAYREFREREPPLPYDHEARYRLALLALREGTLDEAMMLVESLIEDCPPGHPAHQRAHWIRVTQDPRGLERQMRAACSAWVTTPTEESRVMLERVEDKAVWKEDTEIRSRWQRIRRDGIERLKREDRARDWSPKIHNRLQTSRDWKVPAYLVERRDESLFVMRRRAATKRGHVLVAWTQAQLGQRLAPLLSADGIGRVRRPDFVNQVLVGLEGRGIWGHMWPTRGQLKRLKSDRFADPQNVPIATNLVAGFEVIASAAPGAIAWESNKRIAWFALLMLAAGAISFTAWRFTRRSVLHLDALNQEKSNFVSSVSHELRAPVAAMQLMAESLFDGKIRDENQQREYFGMILRECRRLGALVHNVLDFARIEQRRKRYEFSSCDLRELVEHVANLMRPSAEERGISLRVNGPPLEAEVDAAALQQAVINLLDNAIKFSPANSEVTVELGELPDGDVHLTVSDQGPGVPPEQREKIFERFYRREDELRRETMGVGIGLSIVKHVIAAHGGAVKVVEHEGQGAAFVIELPARPPKQEDVTNPDS